MRICLIVEGAYPYVTGGVSSWVHQLIKAMPQHEFVLWTVGAKSSMRKKFKYQLPGNVVGVYETFLADALEAQASHKKARFSPAQIEALEEFVHCGKPDWDVLFDQFYRHEKLPMSFLVSEPFMDIVTNACREEYPYIPFADMFHTLRSMLLPVLYSLSLEVPQADVYHTIATGYSGLLACLGAHVNPAPIILSEHGIYTREREEEIIRAQWVQPAFKQLWIKFFNMLSSAVYDRAYVITSLFDNARKSQISLGCQPEKCRVIPNGVNYDNFAHIPFKQPQEQVEIGAILRIAPIKDVKTLIYAFAELKHRVKTARLHICGPDDDPEYAQECRDLVRQLGVKDVIFAGTVNVREYFPKLDFTVLSSISEGQPLTVLESFAAGRPCVVTDVGCCRELVEGGVRDDLGVAGYCVEPMNRMALCNAMERMCLNTQERLSMAQAGRQRVQRFYKQESTIRRYTDLYEEVVSLWQA